VSSNFSATPGPYFISIVAEECAMFLSRRHRSAFTLIELLVVIAIIAILIGLLVPAVQKVRAAAARAQCQNNLKQIGLACHMFQDNYKKLPPGWVTSPDGAVAPSPGWSWATLILPYIEQGPLFQQLKTTYGPINTTTGTTAPPASPTALLQTVIPVYLCPADGSGTLNTNFNSYAKNNYVANRYVFGPDASSRMAPLTVQGIRDGSSNVYIIGERDMMVNIAGCWIRHSNTSASFEGRSGGANNPQPAAGAIYNTGSNERLAFNSQHTGGCNFVFADGSVHFLANSIDADPADNWQTTPFGFVATNINFNFNRMMLPADGVPLSYTDF